jgi:Ni/Co efflux regulator RcnB
MLYDSTGKEIKKSINTLYTNEATGFSSYNFQSKNKNPRGVQIYDISQIRNISARDQHGQLTNWGIEEPFFYLTIQQRIEISRLSSPIFGVVTSRMNRLAGLDFNIVSQKKKEDEIAERMKDIKSVYVEIKDSIDIKDLMLKAKLYQELKFYLPELKTDLSNFNSSLIRWKRKIRFKSYERNNEIKDWLMQPNNGTSWIDFTKKYVYDLMVHGATAIYKDVEQGKLENFDLLPGGSVYKIKNPAFSGKNGYVQLIPGVSEAQIYFDNEMVYTEYIPTSGRGYSLIPLEALINKIAESLFFDRLMAEQADGTKPPEKMIIVTDSNPFGTMDEISSQDIPINKSEQNRIEQKVNQPTKNAIMTFSGNDAKIIDLSRENTMETQRVRQKDIREEVALVFNMSNMEVNLTGSESTSGRSTSIAQAEIEQGKGIAPIAKNIEWDITKGILPYRFGSGYIFEFEKAKNKREELEIELLELQTGRKTQNEIREEENKTTFEGEQYDFPKDTQFQQGENTLSPMYVKNID